MHRQGGPGPMLRSWVPYAVLAVGLIVTLTGTAFLERNARARDGAGQGARFVARFPHAG